MNLLLKRRICMIVMTVGLIIVFFTFLLPLSPILPYFMIGGGVLLVAACVMFIVLWRCPECHKMLPLKFFHIPEECPACKYKIEN